MNIILYGCDGWAKSLAFQRNTQPIQHIQQKDGIKFWTCIVVKEIIGAFRFDVGFMINAENAYEFLGKSHSQEALS